MGTPKKPSAAGKGRVRTLRTQRASTAAKGFRPKMVKPGKEKEWEAFIARAKPGSQDRGYSQIVIKGTAIALKALHTGKSVEEAIKISDKAVGGHSDNTYRIMIQNLIFFSPRGSEVKSYFEERQRRIREEVDSMMPRYG